MLGNLAIKQAISEGKIVITPFDEDQLGPNSYDLRLGDWFVRQKHEYNDPGFDAPITLGDPVQPHRVWGKPQRAEHGIIEIDAGELILAHTEEYVSCYVDIVGEMASRSTMMRNGIAVCIDAGLGDVGYAGRWTMEIYNHLNHPIVLEVGWRVAQMKFHRVEGVDLSYSEKAMGGEYGGEQEWRPEDMLPRSRMR